MLGNGVTTIGFQAFQHSSLTSVTIPDSVTIIGNDAFLRNDLEYVMFGNSVRTIGRDAFGYNNLTSVNIPDSVIFIGLRAFSNNNLTDVTIGNGVRTIEEFTFAYNNLTSVAFGNSVIGIGLGAFDYNPDLADFRFTSAEPPGVSGGFWDIAPDAWATVPPSWGEHGVNEWQSWHGLNIIFSAPMWTVTFDPANGTHIGGGSLSQTIPQYDEAFAPVVSRSGWIFDGWDVPFDYITENITVTAQWLRLGAVATGGKGNPTSADLVWLARHLARHTGFEVLPEKRVANLRGEDRDARADDITALLRWLVGYDLDYLISQMPPM
jgi:hypothetical protein